MDWPSTEFHAMGSTIGLWLDSRPATARRAFEQVETLFAEAEAQLSRFRTESELCRLNRQPEQWVSVSPLMAQALAAALDLAQATGGLFDPTILPALEAAGYTASFEQMQAAGSGPAAPVATVAPVTGRWQQVQLDRPRRAVWLPAGVRLDLGGVAKGLVAAQAAALLGEQGPALVDAGGDLTATDAPHGWPGWPVAVAAPNAGDRPDEDLFGLWLSRATLATSGIDYRRWQQGTETAHHLIDPRTGRPAAGDLLSATVLAEDAITAEGWATAALVAGRTHGLALLTKNNFAAVLVDSAGQARLTPAMEAFIQ